MATVPNANIEGPLYELVSRGKKDTFFFSDTQQSKFAFDSAYEAQAPHASEIRRIPSSTSCEFGRTISYDFDLVGDIMRNPTLIIHLPSWLPPSVEVTNPSSVVTDTAGVSYGYTNGIAYFLFEQIQFYQDNILLQEFSGDYLWASTSTHDTLASSRITSTLTGEHDGSTLDIGRNATPGQLRLELPIIGCQTKGDPGFPQRAALSHTYRLRCKIRKLEDLVESSDGRLKPQPWGRTDFQQTVKGPITTSFNTLARSALRPLDIQLETQQVYIPREYQDAIQTRPQKVSFVRPRESIFTQNQLDYINVTNGGTSLISRRLEGRHPTERIIWFFRSVKDINSNRLWKVNTGTTGAQAYYNSVNFQVAGKDRELARGPLIWRDVNNFAKESIDTGMEINTMNWGLGAITPQRFPDHDGQITGSVNFTTADRPSFYIDLAMAPIDPYTGAPNTELRVIVEGRASFQTDGKGRAELFSAN